MNPHSHSHESAPDFVVRVCNLSVSLEIVVAREDFVNHGWTRINTDEDGLSLIRVHPCSSVFIRGWSILVAASPRCAGSQRCTLRGVGKFRCVGPSDALPNTIRRYSRLKISCVRQKICFERAAAFSLPLLLTKGGEGRGEEALFINSPSLRLSPRSFLAGRERQNAASVLRAEHN